MSKKKSYLFELWKKMWRWILTLPGVQWIGGFLAYLAVLFVEKTCKYEYKNHSYIKSLVGKPAIFTVWHGRTMMLATIARKFGFDGVAVASRHRDGRLIAKMLRFFGIKSIYGSTGRPGAVSVLREGLTALRQGKIIMISPDGPKGPHMHIHDGALYFAKMTGYPIIPTCYSCSRPWFQWGRWDKYLVAKPFSKITIDFGQPFYIGKKDDIEQARQKLEKIMTDQMHKLDAELGLPKIY